MVTTLFLDSSKKQLHNSSILFIPKPTFSNMFIICSQINVNNFRKFRLPHLGHRASKEQQSRAQHQNRALCLAILPLVRSLP
jgi:hypothetical protein